jgi:hypothetical protein
MKQKNTVNPVYIFPNFDAELDIDKKAWKIYRKVSSQ